MKTFIYFLLTIMLLPLLGGAQECPVIGAPINTNFDLSDLHDQMNEGDMLPSFSACTMQGIQIDNTVLDLEEISLIIVGNASCPPAREFMLWCRDKGVRVYIWYTLENHPISGGALWNNWQPFPEQANVPDWEFAQTVSYGDQAAQIDLLRERFSLNEDVIFLLDDINNSLSKTSGRPFNLFVVRDQQILFESPSGQGIASDSIPFVNLIDSLNQVTLDAKEGGITFGTIAPNPVTSQSHWTGNDDVRITIDNVFGSTVLVSGSTIDVNQLIPGFYIATVRDRKGGLLMQQKIVKQ